MDRFQGSSEQANNSPQEQDAQHARTSDKPDYPISEGGLIRFLWSNIDSETLPDAHLEYLAYGTETMAMSAMNLGKTLAGVAALIQTEIDLHDERKMTSGALQPYGLVEFLYGMSEIAATIKESLLTSSEAEVILRNRWEQRARALGFKDAADVETNNG